jgi:hypothetical protein
MELDKKFADVTSGVSNLLVRASALTVGCRYAITGAERVVTRYGPTVLLGIVGDELGRAKFFLPRRYGGKFLDSDIEDINAGTVKLFLIYRGTCTASKAVLLAIEK